MGVDVLSFGCRLNALDGESVRALALAGGPTDMVVVNACAVTAEAGRQGRQAVRRAARERPGAEIVVTGCGAQVEPAAYAAMPQVSRVVGLAARTRPETWARPKSWAGESRPRVDVENAFAVDDVSAPPAAADILRPRASVQAQTGCDHRCTFCVIPFGRGASRSTPAEAVVAEIRRVVSLGAVEAVLTGVDLTAWGADLPGTPRLGALVRAILKAVPELGRLRLSSLDAVEVDDELLGALGDEERLAPHLHLSLQSGDDMILKRMKRRHSADDAIRFCERARLIRPDIAFGADVIAGFPTETEAMFENTLGVLDACGVAYVHAFPFSARPETPAARMPQTPAPIVKARAARLRGAGAALLAAHLDRHLGRTAWALSEGAGVGRLPDFTLVALPESTPKGALVVVTPAGHDGRRLILDPSA